MELYGPLIDRVVYTASLASRTDEIDPLLDNFREVTARVDRNAPITAEDKNKLLLVQHQLENYLLTQEKIRLFTAESLQLQIGQHMQGNRNTRYRTQLAIVLSLDVVVALAAALLLPLATTEQRGLVGGATAFSILTIGAASFFLTALPAFRSELRRAFLFICVGVTLLGISLLGQPIMEIYNLRQYPLTSILYTLPILIAATLFHTGDILYARLMGVKNRWTTITPVLIASVAMIVISIAAPHGATSESEAVHDSVAVMWGVMLVTPVCSAIALRMALGKVSELYKPSIGRLFESMFPIIAVVSYQYIVRIVAGPYMHGVVAYALFGLVACMGLGLIRAGYTFNKTGRY